MIGKGSRSLFGPVPVGCPPFTASLFCGTVYVPFPLGSERGEFGVQG
jgi:hypothetical protein